MNSVIALLCATLLTGFGVVLFIQANMGSDTITVFLDGLRSTFRITLGEASRMYNLGALLIALILSRKDIGWTSIVFALSTGFVMDFFDPILQPLQISQMSFFIRILVVLIGQACIILSLALLIRFGRGMDQLDAIAYGINRKVPLPFMIVRTSMDCLLLIVGFFMGGVVGIGSIIAMSTTGAGIDILLKTKYFTNKTCETKKGLQYEEAM